MIPAVTGCFFALGREFTSILLGFRGRRGANCWESSAMRKIRTVLLAVFVAAASPLASGQDAQPVTAANPEYPSDQLELALDPLDAGELLVEAKAWQAHVKAKAVEVAQAVQEAREAEEGSSEHTRALAVVGERRAELKELIARLELVVAELGEKGGDPKAYTDYLAGLSVATPEAAEARPLATALREWAVDKDGGIKWAKNLAIFAVILIAAWIVGRVLKRVVGTAMDRHEGSSELLDKFVKKLIGRLVFFIGVLVGLSTLGVNVGALLALIGGASFIIGFAMQDTLGNFVNGIMLLVYQPFDVGDVVEVGGVTGIVDSVSLVSTTIKTFDNKRVLVPNKSVWGQVITNITVSGTRRIDLVFGIGYGDDVEKAQAVLERLVESHELVLKDPAPTIKVDALADSSVNFIVRPWVKSGDFGTVRWDLIKSVKLEFDREGINFPFPQREVHLIQQGA